MHFACMRECDSDDLTHEIAHFREFCFVSCFEKFTVWDTADSKCVLQVVKFYYTFPYRAIFKQRRDYLKYHQVEIIL